MSVLPHLVKAFSYSLAIVSGTVFAQQHDVVTEFTPSSIGIAPVAAYERSEQGQISSVGLMFGEGHLRLVTAVARYTGTESGRRSFSRDIDFTNFDTSLRLGVFDELSLYAEAGLALDELIADEEGKDYYDAAGNRVNRPGPLDWFAGVGAGIEQRHWSVLAFGRYRYLRSYEQEYLYLYPYHLQRFEKPEPHQWFVGIEVSLRF